MNTFKTACISALLVTGVAGQASAHAAWIADRNGEMAVVYGELSDDAYDTSYIESIEAHTADMGDCEVTRTDYDSFVSFTACDDAAYVATAYMRGYSTKDADGNRHSLPMTEVEGAASGGYYVKYATAIVAPLGGDPVAQGNTLEILPLTDPTRAEAGDKLTVQVLFEGEPLAGARFYRDYAGDHMNIFTSDADGKVTFQVRNNGLNVLATKHNVLTPEDPKQDKFGYYATFSFTSLNARREQRAAERAAEAAAAAATAGN